MNCKKERKLFKLRMEAENNFRSISLPPATDPLGIEIPLGHSLTKEHREEIRRTKEKLNTAKETYQNHIKNCPVCND